MTTGTLEAVSKKFNGGVKVDGKWLNLVKDSGINLDSYIVGKAYVFVTKENTSKGKTYNNVVKITELGDTSETGGVPPPAENSHSSSQSVPTKSRDFDREARGKTRCQMFSAALQSPLLTQYFYTKEAPLDEVLKTVKEVAEEGVRYTFGD